MRVRLPGNTCAGLVIVAAAGLFYLTASASAQEPLPSRPTDPYAVRILELEQELARRDAFEVGLRADLATCSANTEQAKHQYESLVLTNDVQKAVDKLKSQFPGSAWYWDNDQRRIVPAKPETPPASQPAASPSKETGK